MTDTSPSGQTQPLGVGNIISESFSILMANLVKVLILGFIGTFLGYAINGLFLGFDFVAGTSEDFNFGVMAIIFSTIIPMVIYGLVTALLVQLAYDAKLNRQRSLSAYFGPALSATVPIAVLSLVIAILTGLGAIALIIGALWVYAVFSVTAPAIVIEKAGFSGMSRSAALTKEYRWPIVGVLIVIFIIVWVLQLVVSFAAVGLITGLGGGFVGFLVFGILSSLIGALGYGLGGISVALIYARLREIKEGLGVDEIASVFE